MTVALPGRTIYIKAMRDVWPCMFYISAVMPYNVAQNSFSHTFWLLQYGVEFRGRLEKTSNLVLIMASAARRSIIRLSDKLRNAPSRNSFKFLLKTCLDEQSLYEVDDINV